MSQPPWGLLSLRLWISRPKSMECQPGRSASLRASSWYGGRVFSCYASSYHALSCLVLRPGLRAQGALVAQVDTECCTTPPCDATATIDVSFEALEKIFTVPFGMMPAVTSTSTVSFSEEYSTTLASANLLSTFALYQWTSTYFNCQVRGKMMPRFAA